MGPLRTLLVLSAFIAVAFANTLTQSSITERYKGVADQIRNYFLHGQGQNQTYNWLQNLTDTFGNRYATSPRFIAAMNHVMMQLKQAGADNVWTEAVEVPFWDRGDPNAGQAFLTKPRQKMISILALGNSTATPPGGISAKAIVVRSYDELDALPAEKVVGRIVVYNQPWEGYENSVVYRGNGSNKASLRGAVAALVRSVTPQSLYTLHTGGKWDPLPGIPDIPVASITVEDAELLQRLQDAGNDLEMQLQLNSKYFGTTTTYNIVADFIGSPNPNEMVLFGGHFDSWDVGEGAMDDGGGVAITFQALAALAKLGLRPKRTIRAVFWTAEELGYYGANAYYAAHKDDAPRISLVMESDEGTFNPIGVHYTGNTDSQTIMKQVMDLLMPINASLLAVDGDVPGDPGSFVENDGVPGIQLYTQNDKYFWYHHTNADSMTMMNSTNLDLCSTLWATIAYVVADMDSMLPHGH